MNLARLVQYALATPNGAARTMRAGPLVFTVAHKGTRWGIRATLTTADGVTSACIKTDERHMRRLASRVSAIVGGDVSIIGAASSSQMVDAMMKQAAAYAAQKQGKRAKTTKGRPGKPGPVNSAAYARLASRGGRATGSRPRVVNFTPDARGVWAPQRLRYGLPAFPLLQQQANTYPIRSR